MNSRESSNINDSMSYVLSEWEVRGLSVRIRVKAAAASSNAQETLDVSLLSTSGSARCLPSFVAN